MKIYTIIFSLMIGSIAISQNELHLKNLKMLTHGGDNAEAYFSYDNKNATFQSNNSKWGLKCDQIFNLDINKAEKDSTYKPKMISTGKGRTTCSYFLKDNKHNKKNLFKSEYYISYINRIKLYSGKRVYKPP